MGRFTSLEDKWYQLVEDGAEYEAPPRRRTIFRHAHPVLTLLLLWALLLSLYTRAASMRGPPPPPPTFFKKPVGPVAKAADFFREMYSPFVYDDFSNPPLVSEDGKIYNLYGDPIWMNPLGNRVLILDLDNRTIDGEDNISQDEPMAMNDLGDVSAGMLNHYMYSLIHGYSYQYLRIPGPPNQSTTWYKPIAISDLFMTHPQYQFIIVADSTFLFNHPELPIEMLLNHWNITPMTSISMPLNPPRNVDARGRTTLDTGFIIAQNLMETVEMLRAWSDCPTGRYPGCETYADERMYEQTAFNEFVRYDFNRVNDLRELPCDEQTGGAGAAGKDVCDGVFVKRYGASEGLVTGGVMDPLVRFMNERLRDYFVQNRGEYFLDNYE